jgi:release factor glutamine methyltransferase
MTGAVIRAAAERLASVGVPSPRTDAELLAAHVLGVTRTGLLTAPPMSDGELRRYDDLVGERSRRVPLQHLTGRAPFRRLDLAVGPGVFVPRPETEQLVEWALGELRASATRQPVVVDLGAGSGAIALAVADEHPAATVYAVEREPLAAAWLQRNIAHQGASVVQLTEDAVSPATLADLDGTVDLVLTNPPYVPDGASLPEEVAEHDPAAALWGGPDGLAVVRRLVARAACLLRAGGQVGIEHADAQGESVPALLAAAGGWDDVTDHADLAGRPRFTTARRAGENPRP